MTEVETGRHYLKKDRRVSGNMATNEASIRKGHEHYLRQLLLLGQATPECLKALVNRQVKKRARTIEDLLIEAKSTFYILFNKQYHDLFYDESSVNTNKDSWDTQLLYIVISLLFSNDLSDKEVRSLKCIHDQVRYFDEYAVNASLDDTTFKQKWDELHQSLLHLLANADDETQFNCKRLIQTLKSDPVEINHTLVENLKHTTDLKLHVQMAIKERVIPKVQHSVSGMDKSDGVQRFDVKVEPTDLAKLCGIEGKMTLLLGHNDIAFEEPITKRFKYSFQLPWIRCFDKYNSGFKISFEVGRKCPAGQGDITCTSASADAIFKIVLQNSQNIKRAREQVQKKSQSSFTPANYGDRDVDRNAYMPVNEDLDGHVYDTIG